ncbi:ankyrin repeat-containing protein, partial [Trifolium pratense]
DDPNKRFLKLCVPLHKLALKGNWPGAKLILDKEERLKHAAIARGWPTVLHIAAGANHIHFVKELLEILDDNEIELQDIKGNTAFCFAAAAGNMEIVDLMRERIGHLPTKRGGNGYTPIQFAALQDEDWNLLFFACIRTGIYDLALKMVGDNNELAFARDENEETALHVLAQNQTPLDSGCQCPDLDHNHIMINPELISVDPSLIWDIDSKNRTILHIAVLHRHASIFNLVHQIGNIQDILVTYEDDEKNTILHMVAKLAPRSQLDLVSGAAFQMSVELLWFE